MQSHENVSDVSVPASLPPAAPESFWTRAEPWLFPVVPRSPTRFVTFLFWHSLFLTVSTPIARMIYGRWIGILSIESLLIFLGLREANGVHADAYLVYPPTQPLDTGFAIHAGFGLLWLTVGYLQFAVLDKEPVARHRLLGYLSQFAFVGHVGAALMLLAIDTQGHGLAVKAMLASSALLSVMYMVRAIKSARRGDVARHTDDIFRAYVYSIEGAGTIRTVGYVLWLFEAGPSYCQAAHGATATECAAPYALQLICIRLLSLYWIGCYARMRQTEGLTKSFRRELRNTVVIMAAGYAGIVAWA